MPTAEIGAVLQQLQETDRSPQVERSEVGDIVTRIFNLQKDRVKDVSDALVYGTADGEFTNAFLRRVSSRPVSAKKTEISLIYEPANTTFETLPAVGTVIQEIDGNAIEIPIAKNPFVSPGAGILAQKEDGVEAYLSPQPIYRRTEILNSFSFDQDAGAGADSIFEVTSTVGVIDNSPEGITNPETGKWLKVGYNARSVGDKYEKLETWQYASNGWDTNIYASVA